MSLAARKIIAHLRSLRNERDIAGLDSRSARWIARDALRELQKRGPGTSRA